MIASVESTRESLKSKTNFISQTVSATTARWRRLRNEPLFLILLVWAFLFLIAGLINVPA